MIAEGESVCIKPQSLSIRVHRFQFERKSYNKKSEKNLIRNNKYNGYMSKATGRQVAARIGHLVNSILLCKRYTKPGKKSIKYYVNFITLTLSAKQAHSDQHIKREMLGRFMEEIREKYGVINYIWKAEAQKNGNIHFHILIDRYIPHTEIRRIWNSIQDTNGYIDKFYIHQSHRNPNSTDIHQAKKIRNTLKYITKYITKGEGYRIIKGRIWGASSLLHNLGNPSKMMCVEELNEIDRFVKNDYIRVSKNDFYTTYFYKSLSQLEQLLPLLYAFYVDWLLQVCLVPI
jgi:hypothetical protein